MKILVINGGSSSFKCWFHEVGGDALPIQAPKPLWEKNVDWARGSDIRATLEPVLQSLWSGPERVIAARDEIAVVGHRIVHGGQEYREATPLTPKVRAAIARQVEFAPAHNRFELEAIAAIDQVLGAGVCQVAVFDTGFHATLPPAAYVYPGPYEWLQQGIRRFGFHGINHQYASRRAAQLLGRDPESLRLIVLHLGNGASLAAVRGGKSVDTTMGFTPLEGLMMGTRSGSIDPGILIFLLRHGGYTPEQLDRVLNQESGLLGVSGISGDMRQILAAMAAGNARAQLAFDVYAHRLTRETGAMAAVLGGVDALVFTGGVGENSPLLREVLAKQLGFLGLRLDAAKNAGPAADQDIAAADSPVRALMIRAGEEWEIARACYRLAINPQSPVPAA
jgi:acetate kinase